MLPHVVIVNHIPLLTNGKIDRQALLKQYESSCPHIGTLTYAYMYYLLYGMHNNGEIRQRNFETYVKEK